MTQSDHYKISATYYRMSIICLLSVITINWIAGSSPGWNAFDIIVSYALVIFGVIFMVVGINKEYSTKKK